MSGRCNTDNESTEEEPTGGYSDVPVGVRPTRWCVSAVPAWAPGADHFEVYVDWDRENEAWMLRDADGAYLTDEGAYTRAPLPREHAEAVELAREIAKARAGSLFPAQG